MSMTETMRQPLGVGGLVAETFGMTFRRIHIFVGVLILPILLLIALFAGLAYMQGGAATETGFRVSTDGLPVLESAIATVVAIVAVLMIFGMVILTAYDIKSGRRVRPFGYIGTTLRAALPIILNGIVLALPIIAAIFAVGLVGAALGNSGLGSLVIFVLVFVVFAYVAVKFSILVPTIIIERTWLSGLTRSMSLTKGYFWPILGALILVYVAMLLLLLAAGAIVGLAFASGALASLEQPSAVTFNAFMIIALVLYVLLLVLSYIVPSVFSALLYARLREVKEGLGMEDLASVFE